MNYNPDELLTEKGAGQYKQSIAFLGKLVEYIDDIDLMLQEVAAYYDADRAYIFELSADRKTLDNTYEWCREGIEPQIDNLQAVPFESVTVWFAEFERVGAFYISSLDKEVEANSLTYEILEPQGIESLNTAPIYRDDKIIGFIGVDNPRANITDLVILKTTAGVLYSEIERKIKKKNYEIKEITEKQKKQYAQMEEMRDIIASADMGIWRIELIDNEEPRMYADDTMKRLLGIDGYDITPEKVYTEWFSNITPEAAASVVESVGKMQQGFFDENTYLWKHPSKGIRYVRCGGTAQKVTDGYILRGYHYDVDEVVRRDQAQMIRFQKALEEKNEYYSTLGALGDIFYSLHVIDLRKDTAIEFTAKNEVKAIVDHQEGAAEMMRKVISQVTTDEYVEDALGFTDLTTIADRMQDKIILSGEFIGKNVGWYAASFITMEKDEEGKPVKVIYTSRVIDEERKQRESLIHKTQTDEMTGLLNRRAYEEDIYEHNDIPSEGNFIYVSIDANGLKVVNDTLGHTAGDELLIGLCSCMRKSLGKYGRLFRIGGDEFVAILFCDDEEILRVLADFDNSIKSWSGKLVADLSASYGWVSRKEFPDVSVRQLAAIAEKRMYEDKDEYYRKSGLDRRGQQEAHKVLCELYTKILKINITDDTYKIINSDVNEHTEEKGFSDRISQWLHSFGEKGCVHPEDLEEYLRKTDIDYMSEYFGKGKTSLHIFYRRRYENGYKQAMMKIVPANDYKEDDQNLFLYVENIDK